MHIADQMALSPDARLDVYLTTLLFQGGCTAGVAELAAFIASDELAAQRDLCLCDPQNTVEILGWMKRNVAVRAPLPVRMQRVLQMLFQGERLMANIEGGCSTSARASPSGWACRPERSPRCARSARRGTARGRQRMKGSAIPIAARVAQTAMVAGVFHNRVGARGGAGRCRAARGTRAGPGDRRCLRGARARGRDVGRLERQPLAAAVLALEPGAPRTLDDAGLDAVALAIADFVDLKSARTAAHSRATAELAERMARGLGCPPADVALCRRAALVHDLGQVGVPTAALEAPAASRRRARSSSCTRTSRCACCRRRRRCATSPRSRPPTTNASTAAAIPMA